MSAESSPIYEYQVGGALLPDAPSYVVRQADEDLYKALKDGKFCYVLNSRQMGKSSLRVQTMRKLEAEGVACAAIDLTAIGSNVTEDKWYAGIINNLVRNFHLKINLKNWLQEHESLPPLDRLTNLIEDILLKSVSQNIVIFIDEIDSVLSLNYSIDDFFAFIRACYNKRPEKPSYRRLSFALLGVATPTDLIQDKKRTPFNLGQAIELAGFQFQEAQSLAQGLKSKTSNPQIVLQEILFWTGGQPFLTQKLCQLVQHTELSISEGRERWEIENLVQLNLIENWESKDEPEHLRTIRDRILRNEQRVGRLLGLYQQILQQQGIQSDNSQEHIELRLTGLVVKRKGKLEVYNPIYNKVFNLRWVENELADLRPEFYKEAITAWLKSNRQDKSQLLRGKSLQDAQKWASGKNLSNDDRQFLAASLELERQEFEDALKPHKFKFKSGEATSVHDFIDLCDRYPDEAEDYLFNEYFERWLFSRGRTDLANFSENVVSLYQQERRQGLEMFVRGLCEHLGYDPYPKIFFELNGIELNQLDLDEIPAGYQKEFSLKICNRGRGFAWGDVVLEPPLPGVSVSPEFDSLDEILDIQLDTLEVELGDYQGDILISLEGIEEHLQLPLKYKVIKPQLLIKPNTIELKSSQHNKPVVTGSLKVTCESSEVSLKGTASTNVPYLQVTPNSFEDSSLELSWSLETDLLEAGSYNGEICLEINSGEFRVPVYFQKLLRWRIIAGLSAAIALLTGLPMYYIRLMLGNYLSSSLDNSWILSYPPEVREASFLQIVLPPDLLKISEQQLTCSVFGCVILFVSSVIFGFRFRDRLKNFLKKVVLNLTIFFSKINELKENFNNRNSRTNIGRASYHSRYSRSSPLCSMVKIALLLCIVLIVFCLILGLIINFLVNIFAWVGASFIISIDKIIHPLTLINIEQPAIGWLVLGFFTGAILGLIQALKREKEYSYLSKVYKIATTLALILVLTIFFH